MSKKYILAIDQGTTSSRAVLLDDKGAWIDSASKSFKQIYPKPGWVEHDPNEIWESVVHSIKEVISKSSISIGDIVSIGITNQRETIVAWDSKTKNAIGNAIVWQCRRTTDFCEKIKKSTKTERLIKNKTGLVLDPYFSASKINWILKNISEAKKANIQKTLRVGTVDSFLLWKLTDGGTHKTEVSNASRTMLMNLKTLEWDDELLKIFNVPRTILPKIESSDCIFAHTQGLGFLPDGIPISGMIGDQQSALFGQSCFRVGQVKCTFGTGSFILMNTGSNLTYSKHGMLTTVAWKVGGKTTFALEGGAFVCGAAVQWLRDGLGIINSSQEVEAMARAVDSSNGVEFVPALTGLGAPYWIPEARGVITGLTRGSNRNHIARATLEAMALQNVDIVKAMELDLGKKISGFFVDGGATKNNLLLQLQADYLGQKVFRPQIIETTAYGAGLLAGLGAGVWKDLGELVEMRKIESQFDPKLNKKKKEERIKSWKSAIKKCSQI